MFDTCNPKPSTGCHKAGNRLQCLQSVDAAIRTRGTNH